jgi:hypothetical protein
MKRSLVIWLVLALLGGGCGTAAGAAAADVAIGLGQCAATCAGGCVGELWSTPTGHVDGAAYGRCVAACAATCVPRVILPIAGSRTSSGLVRGSLEACGEPDKSIPESPAPP